MQDLATRTRELELAYAEAVETGKFDEDAHASLLGFDRERHELERDATVGSFTIEASERATRAAAAARGVQEMRKAITDDAEMALGLIGEAARLNAKFERNRRIHAAEGCMEESWDESWKQAQGRSLPRRKRFVPRRLGNRQHGKLQTSAPRTSFWGSHAERACKAVM